MSRIANDLFSQPDLRQKVKPRDASAYDQLTDQATLEEMAAIAENSELEEFYKRQSSYHNCLHFQDEFSKRKIELLKPSAKKKIKTHLTK